MILLPIAALEVAEHGRDHPRQILVEVFRTQLHFLIFAQLGNAVLNVNVGGPQRNQKRTAHAECSLASECNFLVDVTVGLFAESRCVEDERIVGCRELVTNPLVPILPSDQYFFVKPGLEARAVESFEKLGRKRAVFPGVLMKTRGRGPSAGVSATTPPSAASLWASSERNSLTSASSTSMRVPRW